jgi:8-oxo-dGTP pyrophosphatase MutT (NUDIX family)
VEAAVRETEEELGVTASLTEVESEYSHETEEGRQVTYMYKSVLPQTTTLTFDTEDVAEVRWLSVGELESWVAERPAEFVPAFITIWEKFRDKLITT